MISEFRFNRDELKYLLPQLLILAGVLLLVVLLCGGAWYELARQQRENDQARHRLTQARQQLAEVEQAKADWEQYGPRFAVFQQTGIVGNEDRLQWVEVLTRLGRESPGLELHFSLTPQMVSDLIPNLAGSLQVYVTRIRLDFTPLHEVAMQQLLASLLQQLRGQPVLRGCGLSLPGESSNAVDGERLIARCDLNLLTIHRALPVNATEEQAP
ncbi:hypothetical protein [Chitinivorax sp. B]|uniref:hypothetical protein n=1 Tax=Chitinivorax sp. B TaxID=2502235 RepID=UPI0010F985F5|nr:hypothetical protein [Chitinivorax sp. B]